VLEARLYAYQRGGATLLEFIDAQRTSAEVYLAYSQTLADHAKALVNLELVSSDLGCHFLTRTRGRR